jgi:hypothetical protein
VIGQGRGFWEFMGAGRHRGHASGGRWKANSLRRYVRHQLHFQQSDVVFQLQLAFLQAPQL